jgi:predicted component of type VI protein secretion system
MKHRIVVAVCLAALTLSGCQSSTPKRPAGMSDERYEKLLEQRRIDLQVKKNRELENKDHMKQFGTLKYQPGYYELLPD